MVAKKQLADVGLQTARIYSNLLAKQMGKELKAIFVGGSMACGMAMPYSDVDVVVVKDFKPGESILLVKDQPEIKISSDLEKRFGVDLHVSLISTEDFIRMRDQKYLPRRRLFKFSASVLRSGALPVFIRKEFVKNCGHIKPPTTKKVNEYKERRSDFRKRAKARIGWKARHKPKIV